jgi:hypothetical protein
MRKAQEWNKLSTVNFNDKSKTEILLLLAVKSKPEILLQLAVKSKPEILLQ